MCGTPAFKTKVLGRRLNQSQGRNPKTKIGITTTVVQCPNCDLIFSNPLPIPFDLQDHYGIPPEDYWTPEYFKISNNLFQNEIRRLKELKDLAPGMKALDIGAGLGKVMKVLENTGLDTYGIEPSKPFHERAISQMGIKPDRLQQVMIEDAEFPENEFDFITLGAVLEHLYDPSDAILKALKWAKSDGLIHIEVPSAHWLVNRLINLYYKFRRMDYVGNISPMHEPFHLYEFGLDSFKLHAAKHGYDIAFHEYFVCATYMPSVLDKIIRPYMARTNRGMQLSIWLQKR